MKNFTNNFKQFTSRLSARWLIIALMMLVGTSSAWAASSFASGDVIYVDVSACSWYENDGCGPGIQLNKTGNYIKMDKVADKLYTYTFAQSVTSFNLGRVPATGTTKHNNFAGNFTNYDPSSKNVFKVNSNSNDGSWESPSFIKVYFDNSNTNWTNIYMCYGHSSYSKMNVKVNNQACGNIYYAIITDNWTDETQIAFHNSTQADTSWGSENGSIAHRYGWLTGDVTHTYDITLDNANGKVFKPSKSTSKLTTGNNGKQIDAHLWGGDDAYAEETFSDNMCCTAPASAPSLSKVSDIVKCGTTTITSGTLEIGTVNTGSAYYYKKGTNGTEQEITLNNKQFTVSSEGEYYVKEVNDCGASSSWSSKVTISETNNSVSVSAISGPDNICSSSSADYSITAIDGVTYNWSINSDKFTLGENGTNSIQVTATGTADATATLAVTATKSECPSTQTKSINLIVPVKTATITPTDEKGTPVANDKKYCVGATAYIKVESDVKYSTATWKSDLGVEVEQIGNSNIYQFEVKGKDQIVVLLSNKCNSEPVSSEPLEVEVYASPSVPEIALGASSICDTNEDGTTLTVTRTKSGQYYALYKEDGNGGIEVEDYQYCTSDNAEIEYTGLKEAAKYFVKTYIGECPSGITRSSSATLTVVDSKNVKISIEPTATETTPWMPVKLTVTATSDYTVTSDPNDAVINISGNIVKVKLPLPTEGVQNKGTTEDGVNVTFDNVPYRIIAELKTAGEEGNPCAQPAIANITLTEYIEICD